VRLCESKETRQGLSDLRLLVLDHVALPKGIANRRQRKELVYEVLHRVNLWEHRRKWLTFEITLRIACCR
jgi:hypothetical protein